MWPFSKKVAAPRECLVHLALKSRDTPEKKVRSIFKKIMPYLTKEETTELIEDCRTDGGYELRLSNKERQAFENLHEIFRVHVHRDKMKSLENWDCCGEDKPCGLGCSMSCDTSEYWSATNPGIIRENDNAL
jgi:hypothetical protein